MASRNWGHQSYNHKQLNPANNQEAWQMTQASGGFVGSPADTLISAWWNPEQTTRVASAQTWPTDNEIKTHHFKLLEFVVICYAADENKYTLEET